MCAIEIMINSFNVSLLSLFINIQYLLDGIFLEESNVNSNFCWNFRFGRRCWYPSQPDNANPSLTDVNPSQELVCLVCMIPASIQTHSME